ncbi:probable chitinase 2 [Toxorhynchites rutilus septentrionalis]|uniref:probable chitinase 2 n=1 Tax=Toxorhynchites rutilus septentrionalis TaxID=329112 RepID=UPI0024792CE3|nr:probable chitinase 2 [Toxorhynchites rutilus septentrionalis]
MEIAFVILSIILLLSPHVNANQTCKEKRYSIVCYLASWSVYRDGLGAFNITDIIPSYCTHLIYSFAGLNLDGGIDSLDWYNDINVNKGYNRIIELKEENPCLKVLLAVGGWNEGSEKYSLMAESEDTRNAFADHALKFIVHFGFDGLDVDWEYPTMRGGLPDDKNNFILLLEALRTKFQRRKKLLSIAISGSTSIMEAAYNLTAICNILDFINLMGYDYSQKNKLSIDAPLYPESTANPDSVDNAVSYIRKSGCPLAKVNLGIPTMAKTYTLKPAHVGRLLPGVDAKGPGRPGPYTKISGVLGYNELCSMIKEEKWNTKMLWNIGAKIATQGDQWATFDDGETVAEKAKYVIGKGLGGVMFWTIDTDDFHGDCHNRVFPMVLSANREFRYTV